MHSGGNLTRIERHLGTKKRTKKASFFGGKNVFSLLQTGFGQTLVKHTSQLSQGQVLPLAPIGRYSAEN